MNKKFNPKVSVILAVKNEEKNIAKCLDSIINQTYKDIEIVVVDNNSSDKTKKIASKFTKKVYDKDPERSAQRNYGAYKSTGEYLFFLDADMILTQDVIRDCVDVIRYRSNIKSIVIPELSIGDSFWARAKALERSFYLDNDEIEAARFFEKKTFTEVGGFDESITGPEDWDLSRKVSGLYETSRIKSFIHHNEGDLSLFKSVFKKSYYVKSMKTYLDKNSIGKIDAVNIMLRRYKIFFRKPKVLFKDPMLGVGMLFMKTLEFGVSALVYLKNRISK